MVYVNDDGSITSNAAPRYRLVGYDIGTAPDANGGWVHWTDYARLEAEIARLRADLANAGAVMVEAALRLPAYDSDGDPAGQFDHHVFVRRDDLRALSTLSPIAAAAGLVADGIDADMRTFNQCLDEEPATGETKAGHFFAQVIRRYARALAEQEKADG